MKASRKNPGNGACGNYEWDALCTYGEGPDSPEMMCEVCHDGGDPPNVASRPALDEDDDWDACKTCPVNTIKRINAKATNKAAYPLFAWTDRGNAERIVYHLRDRIKTNGRLIWKVKIGESWHGCHGCVLAAGIAAVALDEIIMREVDGCDPDAHAAASAWAEKSGMLYRMKRAAMLAQPYIGGLG